jgi:hypothetical protein
MPIRGLGARQDRDLSEGVFREHKSYPKSPPWRSEKYLRAVCELDCQRCGAGGPVQAAHFNENKGMGMKTSDALCAALCQSCHHQLDHGNQFTRDERRQQMRDAVIATMAAMIESGALKC